MRGRRFLFLILIAAVLACAALSAPAAGGTLFPAACADAPETAAGRVIANRGGGAARVIANRGDDVRGIVNRGEGVRAVPTGAQPDAPPVSALFGKLCITEIMEKNHTTITDEDGDFSDWIELENRSDGPVSLSGCSIADREGRRGWSFPDRSLDAGERLILFASKKDRRGDALHTDFALSGKDCVCLYDAQDLPVDQIACAGCEADVSLARQTGGEWVQSLYPTPGFANNKAGFNRFQKTLSAPGPLVINEACVKNLGLNVAGTSKDCDWVEIKNISDRAVELSDYYLSDKHDKLRLWQLPAGQLQPGKCRVFVCGDKNDGNYGSTPCTGFSLNASHDELYLTDKRGALVDRAGLRGIPAGGSYGRMDGRAGFFYFASPSPDRDNTGGKRRVSPMPVSLTPDGVYESAEGLYLALSGSGTLRYTINGPAPTAQSKLYTDPIQITRTCVVSVRNYEYGALPSRPLVLSFFINEGHSLPIASFTAEDPAEFSAIYGAGSKLYEMPGTLAFYRDGDSFRINCAVRLNGETSLIMRKKNMAVHFSGAYGSDRLEYDLFGGGGTSFSALLLRAGQDQYQGVLRNELAQSLAWKADTAVVNQRSVFCVLYLNGEYAGIYTVKERPNASVYADRTGAENVECVEAPALYGSALYEDTVGFVNSHDMRLKSSYEELGRRVDLDSLIDWLILEGFCANTDLTSGNLRYVRSPETDGKWHFVFYDLDAAFRSFDSIQKNLLNSYAAARIQVATFAMELMKNAAFRESFLKRAAALLTGPLSNEAVLEELDRMADEIRPEIPRDFARAGKGEADWEKALEDLRSMIRDKDWQRANIDGICRIFNLDETARASYFGRIRASGTH